MVESENSVVNLTGKSWYLKNYTIYNKIIQCHFALYWLWHDFLDIIECWVTLVKREVGSDFSGHQGLAMKVMIMNYIYIAHFSYGYVQVGFAE
jgi:hypothetical protein